MTWTEQNLLSMSPDEQDQYAHRYDVDGMSQDIELTDIEIDVLLSPVEF